VKTNIALYQESLKSDQVDYETPYESLFRLFSIFVYGRFQQQNAFAFIKKFIGVERFVSQRMGRVGQLLSGSCIMLFQLKPAEAAPGTPQP